MTKKYWGCIKEIFLKTFEDKALRSHFYLGFLILIIGLISTICVPLVLKQIVNRFSHPGTGSVLFILLGYGFVWMVSQAFRHIQAIFTYRIEQRMTLILGLKVLSHLYGLSQSYFLDQKPGALTNVLRKAQKDVPSIVLGIFFHVLPVVIEFFLVLVLISSIYPRIYTIILAATLIMFFIYTFISMKSILNERQITNEVDKNTDGIVIDWLSNHEAIKIFNKQEFVLRTCEKELKKQETAEVKFMTKCCIAHLGQFLILGFGLFSLSYLVGIEVLRGKLTVGDFVLFHGYILQFILPLNILGHTTQDIKKALLDMKGVMDILLTESTIKEPTYPVYLSGHSFHIEFSNVTFRYKERNILEKISFNVGPGETVFIVGPTGIGKSTIARLLLRLYDPTEGKIFINDIDLKLLSFKSLYETIGWVPQETYLLNDTIQNNIHFVRPESSLGEVKLALEQACLLDFIQCLPEGIHTRVGDRGLKLSGGEKQRLAIARLFLKKPKVCIFDESNSSLDQTTEHTIQKNIEKAFPHITKIIITHRTVHRADKIINLDKAFTSERINYV